MSEKQLGKISSAHYGYGGYQEAQFGFWLSFSFKGSGCGTGEGFWTSEPSPNAKWDKAAQIKAHGEIVMRLVKLMDQAKVKEVHELVGVPIEATFDGLVLKDWRILEEVL